MRKLFSIFLLICLIFTVTGCTNVKFGEADNVKLIKKVADLGSSSYFLIVQKNNEILQFKTSSEIYQSISDGNLLNITYDNNFYAFQVIPLQFYNDNQ